MSREEWMDTIYTNLHNRVLGECQINMLNALIDEVGPQQALEAIKIPNIFGGKMIASMVRQQLGIQGNDVVSVAMPYYVAHYGTSRGHIKPMEIRDGKAIIELYACPGVTAGGTPEMCIAVSHYLAMGMCEAGNPDYEFVFTHHLLNGDNCCRYVVKKRSDKFSLDNPGRLEKVIPIELQPSELDMWVEFEAIGQLGFFTYASAELVGSQRTLEIARPRHRKTGQWAGRKLKDDAEGKNDLSVLRDGADLLCRSVHETKSTASIVDFGIEKEITECPFKPYFVANPNNLPMPEVCMQLAEALKGICESISPNYEFTFDRMMSKGDHCCHWVVKKKGIQKEVKSEQQMEDSSLSY